MDLPFQFIILAVGLVILMTIFGVAINRAIAVINQTYHTGAMASTKAVVLYLGNNQYMVEVQFYGATTSIEGFATTCGFIPLDRADYALIYTGPGQQAYEGVEYYPAEFRFVVYSVTSNCPVIGVVVR